MKAAGSNFFSKGKQKSFFFASVTCLKTFQNNLIVPQKTVFCDQEILTQYFYCICDQACLRFNLLHISCSRSRKFYEIIALMNTYLMNSFKQFCFVFPPFTDKVVLSYYASWVMFFTRPWSHLTWIFQWSFRVTAESRKLADKLHTMNSCFQILHRSVDAAKGSTQCIFV